MVLNTIHGHDMAPEEQSPIVSDSRRQGLPQMDPSVSGNIRNIKEARPAPHANGEMLGTAVGNMRQ